MSHDHGSLWNPQIVGPLDRCLRCWTPFGDDVAYCTRCGKITSVFKSLSLNRGERCSVHQNSTAERTCCLCGRPICKDCCDHVITPIFMIGEQWYCCLCVKEAKTIEKRFFDALSRSNCCAKHEEIISSFTCKICGLPLCLSCTYFTAAGIFKKRPADGPYCLTCFRSVTSGRNRNIWFSGHDVT